MTACFRLEYDLLAQGKQHLNSGGKGQLDPLVQERALQFLPEGGAVVGRGWARPNQEKEQSVRLHKTSLTAY